MLLVVPLMALVVVLTRYVPLASLAGSVVTSVAVVALGLGGELAWSLVCADLATTAIIVLKHVDNIRRMLNGTERRFGEKASSAPTGGIT